MSARISILCVSHLVWEDRLFQRPQQLMTRFERAGCRVRYVATTSSRRWARMQPGERMVRFGSDGVAWNRPLIPLSGRSRALRGASVALALRRAKGWARRDDRRVLWLQNPAFGVAADRVEHDVLVYDRMDPFGAFGAAATGTDADEHRLLGRADVVFAGGRSLYAQIAERAPQAISLPSGIDFPHFASAAGPGEIPPELRGLPRPVLGYFGAVDERIDWELLRQLCAQRPQSTVVLVGPLVGLADCPIAAPNFLHVGARPYGELPAWLRGFDAALIPWLVNDLTRFMSPTKTPEYLASGCPVVSTAIPDVVADYGDHVFVARDGAEFVRRCDAATARGKGDPVKPPAARTWEEIAERMLAEIERAGTE